MKEHHAVARDAFWWWKLFNKPHQDPIYHSVKSARARFKYALRATKRAEETARANALATDLYMLVFDYQFCYLCVFLNVFHMVT